MEKLGYDDLSLPEETTLTLCQEFSLRTMWDCVDVWYSDILWLYRKLIKSLCGFTLLWVVLTFLSMLIFAAELHKY